MTQFTEPEILILLAGLRNIQSRLAAHRLDPDSLIGKLLTKDGAYRFPSADELEPLIAQLTQDQAGAPADAEPAPSAIEAVVKLVILHPTAVFTADAIQQQGYDNLARYVDQMLADGNEEALISQEVLFVSGAPRPLTADEHEAMYGDLPYPNPNKDT